MKVTFSGPIEGMTGSFGKNDPYVVVKRNGKYFLQRKPRKRVHKDENGVLVPEKTSKQQQQRDRFKALQQMSCEIMRSPTLRKEYEERWKKQKKYPTLRGYITGMLNKTFYNPQTSPS